MLSDIRAVRFGAIAALAAVVLAAVSASRARPAAVILGRAPSNSGYLRAGQIISYDVLLIINASCHASTLDSLPRLWRDGVARLRRELRTPGARTFLVGIATDPSLDKGVALLRAFPQFDEVSIGRGWLNSHVLTTVARGEGAELTVPQVVVIRRHVWVDSGTIALRSSAIVQRFAGLPRILFWARDWHLPSEKEISESGVQAGESIARPGGSRPLPAAMRPDGR